MDYSKAMNVLKQNYELAGYRVLGDVTDGFELSISSLTAAKDGSKELQSDWIDGILISSVDIKQFANSYETWSKMEITPNDCSICNSEYRENLLGPLTEAASSWLKPDSIREIRFECDEIDTSVTIAPCSMNFYNNFRFSRMMRYSIRNEISSRAKELGDSIIEPPIDILDLHRPYTVQVHNIDSTTIEDAILNSNNLIDSSLFHISVNIHLHLRACDKWIDSLYLKDMWSPSSKLYSEPFSIKAEKFNPELLKYYWFGSSSNLPEQQFLSFYQIFEYFFLKVSEKNLYAKLKSTLDDKLFNTTSKNLDRIVALVQKHRSKMKDIQMLQLVLKTYLDEDYVIKYIQSHEDLLGEMIFSGQSQIFGKPVKVQLTSGHLWNSLANRFVVVRNALVHSSDKYERDERYIPLSIDSEIVERELPIIKHLAEMVIFATSESLTSKTE